MGNWLRRFAFLSILGFPIALFGTRLGVFEFVFGFKIITWTVLLALLVLVLGLIVWFWQRKSNKEGSKAARQAAVLALLPLLGIGSQLVTARSLPEIHNISTDIVDPPQFSAIADIRGAKSNPLAYDAAVLGPQQSQAYPEVKTLSSSLDSGAAFARALELTKELGWEVVAVREEQGIIEASETTAMWGFVDDVVIRISATNNGSEVDLRSVSRVGRSDLGANAKRITKFLKAFE